MKKPTRERKPTMIDDEIIEMLDDACVEKGLDTKVVLERVVIQLSCIIEHSDMVSTGFKVMLVHD